MTYQLVPALMEDQAWLERLRRDLYLELFVATFGSWDEVRHARQFSECLTRGGISIIKIDDMRVGMIQVFDQPGGVEVGEIQIQPSHQNLGIGTRVLIDAIIRGRHPSFGPRAVGTGVRLIDGLDFAGLELEQVAVSNSPFVTHIKYRFSRPQPDPVKLGRWAEA